MSEFHALAIMRISIYEIIAIVFPILFFGGLIWVIVKLISRFTK
jgi:hypothetical protein